MTTDHDDDRLAPFWTAARGGGSVPDALMARVLADAARVQATRPAPPPQPAVAAPRHDGLLAGLRQVFGGWPALSGVTLAGVTGLALGLLAPDLVDGLSGGQIGIWSGATGTLPEIGLLWAEGDNV